MATLMNINSNMKKLEILAFSLEDAKLKAFEQGITIIKNVTKEWKESGQPILAKPLDIFGANILEKNNLFGFLNAGVIITFNKKKKPNGNLLFKFVNYPKKGPRKMKRVVELRNIKTDELINTAKNKKVAIKMAKEIVRKTGLDIYGVTKYVPENRDFEMFYEKAGEKFLSEFLVFYVDEGDVRLYKQQLRNF